MLDVAKAEAQIIQHTPDFGVTSTPIALAHDEVSREVIKAERDQPPFDRVTMDGIAVAWDAWQNGLREFKRQGTQGAGQAALSLADESHCIEIMTGAVLPVGCDCVIPVEEISFDKDLAMLKGDSLIERGQFIHRKGSDYLMGETLLEPGAVLRAPEMAVLASCGYAEVEISRRPNIAVFAIGDELVDVDQPLKPHLIRRSNDYAIAGALYRHRFTNLERFFLPDDPQRLTEGIGMQLRRVEVLILTGGVSMGKYDYIPGVLESLGIELIFHKVSQRPGKPMWFGLGQAGQLVFALPGNPVSALTCCVRYVIPALFRGLGATNLPPLRVKLQSKIDFEPGLTWFLPVKLHYTPAGDVLAEPTPPNTSGDFATLTQGDGFVELPREETRFEAGFVAPFYPW